MFYSIEKSMKIIWMQTLQKNNGFGTSCRIISFFSTNAWLQGAMRSFFLLKVTFSSRSSERFIIANLAKFRLVAEHCYLTACFHFVFWYGLFMCVFCLSLRSFMYDGTVFYSLNISGFILCVIHKHFMH